MKTTKIRYCGRQIAVEEVEEIGGDFNDLYDFNDTLLLDRDGNYYLKQVRVSKMPPNADHVFTEEMLKLGHDWKAPENRDQLKRIRAWRLGLVRPRVTIKRIKEKTALLWCVHSMINNEHMRARLRTAVTMLVA